MSTVKRVWRKFVRELSGQASVTHVAAKSARYALEIASAKLWLAQVDDVGNGVRTVQRPRIENFGYLSIGDYTSLRSINVPIELTTGYGARLEIGSECSFNYGVSIGCTQRITIGNRVRLGPYVMIVDNSFHELYDRDKRPPSQPVVIEDDVWIGAKASVMPGITIGRGSVVGTSAVVTKDVPPFTVVAGVPAQPVKTLDPQRFVMHSH
jgi:acetyltransferase-like isoleucine patch superfamily enzyme